MTYALEDVDLASTSIRTDELRELFRASTNRERLYFARLVMTKKYTEDARYAFAIDWVRRGKTSRLTNDEATMWHHLTYLYNRRQKEKK